MEIPFIESQSFGNPFLSSFVGIKIHHKKMGAAETKERKKETINTFWKANGGYVGGGNLMVA